VQGFLVIETTRSVDVTATYSAGPITVTRPPSSPTAASSNTASNVASVHVERIRERSLSDEDTD